MNNNCIACGMPLGNKEDIGSTIDKGSVCKFCITPEGNVKSCNEIFNGGVQYFMQVIPGVEREFAERITRKNMNKQPYWQGTQHECLKGEEATEKEFQESMSKLVG